MMIRKFMTTNTNGLKRKTLSFVLGFFFALFSTQAFAASFTIKSVTGSSKSDLTATTPVIYAAVNDNDCSTWDGGGDGDPDQGCAINPVTASTEIKICFTHDYSSDSIDNINVFMMDKTSDGTVITANSGSDTGIEKGSEKCALFTLGNLCDNETDLTTSTDSSTSCNGVIDDEIYLVGDVDKDGNYDSGSDFYTQIDFKMSNWTAAGNAVTNSGNCTSSTTDISCILNFYLFSGDNKAHIYNASGNDIIVNTSAWPKASKQLQIKYIRFYYEAGETTAAGVNVNTTTSYEDIELTDEGGLKKTYIGGLTNGQPHAFRVALVDEAGSVGYMMDAATTASSTFVVTPEEVYGIFDESKCFIATAAFGSPLEPKINSLRNFRDQVLRNYKWGREFTKWYYMTSPKYAVKLLDSPKLQKLVQVSLWPVWVFSELSLRFGLDIVLLFISLTFYLMGRSLYSFNLRRHA
jgi:hypothetical protein